MGNFYHSNAAIREIELGRPRYIGYLVLGVGGAPLPVGVI